MKYKNIYALYFSATYRTEIVTKKIAQVLKDELNIKLTILDFTLPDKRLLNYSFKQEDIVVVGSPVYAGRIPNFLLDFLKTIIGGGALAIPLVTFGNRNYDDALIELRDILIKGGFKPISGGAFVGEHSFSDLLGMKRPDENDLYLGGVLAKKSAEIILSNSIANKMLKVPGVENPYRGYFKPLDRFGNYISILKVKPKTSEDCTDCKICTNSCPMGSIDFDDVSLLKGICVKCCACIKKCPRGAKYFDDPGYLEHLRDLESTYTDRVISEIFY